MKLNPKRRKWLIGGAALLLTATPELRSLRHRGHRVRPHQLRQPCLPAHHAGDAIQHAQEQHRALLVQTAVADDADCS